MTDEQTRMSPVWRHPRLHRFEMRAGGAGATD